MMVANAPGQGGGLGANSEDPAGFDPLMKFGMFRRTNMGSYDQRVSRRYKRWLKSLGQEL